MEGTNRIQTAADCFAQFYYSECLVQLMRTASGGRPSLKQVPDLVLPSS